MGKVARIDVPNRTEYHRRRKIRRFKESTRSMKPTRVVVQHKQPSPVIETRRSRIQNLDRDRDQDQDQTVSAIQEIINDSLRVVVSSSDEDSDATEEMMYDEPTSFPHPMNHPTKPAPASASAPASATATASPSDEQEKEDLPIVQGSGGGLLAIFTSPFGIL